MKLTCLVEASEVECPREGLLRLFILVDQALGSLR